MCVVSFRIASDAFTTATKIKISRGLSEILSSPTLSAMIVVYVSVSTLENQQRYLLSERLVSLGIMKAPLRPLGLSQYHLIEGFNGGPELGPHYAANVIFFHS